MARICTLSILFLSLPIVVSSQTIGIFYDSNVEQIKFAAGDVKAALESKSFTVELLPLSSLDETYANKKVVIALASNTAVAGILTNQGGTIPTGLGEQAYGLITTTLPQTSYWVFGGDANGAMYGGLQIAENIKFNGFSGTYSNQESPAILKRGIKLNLPLDKESPTYGKTNHGGFEGTSYSNAIPHVWDSTFWFTWFDEMARNRYNTVSIWLCHPFASLIKMAEYPDVAIQNVTGFNNFSKIMSIDEKIVFWKKIMAYAHSRGFEFYFFNWNIFTYGATGKYGITESASNPATVTYMYKSMIKLFETYPDLDGFGVTNGENGSNEDFLWETYGKGLYDYALANPDRKLRFIHRWHWTNLTEIKSKFAPLFTLPNVTFDMSYKYSVAHMYSVPVPNWWGTEKADLAANNMKTWLTVRNDEMYYHNWGDPGFARTYVNGIVNLGEDMIRGFYMGSDGFCPTRTFFAKDSVSQNILEIQRQWYMYMLWGRLSYNPGTSDEVFKNYMNLKYPTVSTENIFTAWSKASSCIPKITEMVQGSWTIDLNWWLEGSNFKGGFRTASNFSDCNVAKGSSFCTIANSANNNCNGKKTSLQVANEIENDALSALSLITGMSATPNSELGVALNNIRAMSYMAISYAYKIRGATYIKAGATQNTNKIAALGKTYCWWIRYTSLMDSMYTGMSNQRVDNLPNWHFYDANVLKDYTDNGGIGIPNCNNTPQAPYAYFTANNTVITRGETINFTDQSTETPTSWLWSFEGGNPSTSTDQNPSVRYDTLGTYSVTLIATNAVGNDAETKTGYITVSTNVPVQALTDWVLGTSNNKVNGKNRLMTVFVMGEHSAGFSATGVTYGSQAMTKQSEKLFKETTSPGSYASIFTLNEAGVNAAASGTIEVTWSATPSAGNSIYSVLLGNVDQTTPVSASATNGLTGTILTTNALATGSGDMVVMCGATANNNTVTFNNGFIKQFEANPSWGDGIGGTKMGSGASETPGFTQSASGRMALCAIVVKNASAFPLNVKKVIANECNIYPNPTSGILNIDFGNISSNREIKIYNSLYQLVYSTTVNSFKEEIDLRLYNLKGIAFVQVISYNKVSNYKVILY